MYILLVGKAIK